MPMSVSLRLGLLLGGLMTLLSACAQSPARTAVVSQSNSVNQVSMDNLSVATFGGGCFWCTEAVFQRMDGVEKVVSGYTGGALPNPTYKQICTGTTGHAEVIQIYFDPAKVSFGELLEVHFATHDPTTLNRQGNDVGTQYRSAVFYHNEEQKDQAQ
ncbi:MAG: peptide-methionine (S)-S-oxide reductase MsrA, partial [Bacteroidota bacterium]